MGYEFKIKTTIVGGSLIIKKNYNKIVAKSNRLCTHHPGHPGIDPKGYKEEWTIRKEPEGYIFREVTHDGGISGHHKSVRELIIAAASSAHIKVFFRGYPEEI